MYINKSNLLASFIEEGKINSLWGEANIKRIYVGDLNVPSGKIYAVDPYIISEYDKSFLNTVPIGKYPIYISIVTYESGDQRIAFAAIQFSDKNPISWEMAVLEGQDISSLKEDEFFGYGVDAGTGCFMDESTFKKFYELAENDDFIEKLNDEFYKTYVHTWSCLNKSITDNNNIVMFSSGIGDGVYPSFWGKDICGNICCLVTDFMIIE
jgi:hypothetical protein